MKINAKNPIVLLHYNSYIRDSTIIILIHNVKFDQVSNLKRILLLYIDYISFIKVKTSLSGDGDAIRP